ncbi:MAG TPA: beta-N-acetylhexosaminidase [Acidobacteriaceae bacterium]|nr:beta-N-acetylhexosaminidase [Acidobacteriaceae bacterium]
MKSLLRSRSLSPSQIHRRTRARIAAILLLAFFSGAATCLRAQSFPQPRLIPIPRKSHFSGVTTAASALVIVPSGNSEDYFAAHDLEQAMKARGILVTPNTGAPALTIWLLRRSTPAAQQVLQSANLAFTPAMHREGYVLVAQQGKVSIIAATSAGIFYGVQTLKQLLQGYGDSAFVPTGVIRDWPAMRYRGIDDDLSRGPLPTIAFMKQQIRTFASFKINLYSPYLEDVIQYASDPAVTPPGGSITRSQAQDLARYASRYHIMIVPEQEAFGHLHHVLINETYSDLAENPHGNVLAPHQPGTQQVIKSWFTQLAEDFPSPFLHIGADETFDLGTGRTKAEVEKRGLGPVYADFLSQIHTTLAPLHRRLLFWGDIAWNDPAAIQGLPKDMIAIPWIYWHEDNYDKNILPFKNAGMETWVAPGDANWSQMYPLGDVALDNISGFIESGQRLGSTGALTTVWNDDGEGLFSEDWFGVLFGAAASWQPGLSRSKPYEDAFGQVFFQDSTGKVMQAQQDLLAITQIWDVSDSVFWLDPWSPNAQAQVEKLRPNLHLVRLYAEDALRLLIEAQNQSPHLIHPEVVNAMEMAARRIDFAAMKLQFSDEMAQAYAQIYSLRKDKSKKARDRVEDLFDSMVGNNGRCEDLVNGYSSVRELYKQAWLAENRPFWLNNVLVRYDLKIQLWQQRRNQIRAIAETWHNTGKLPTAEQAGIPQPPDSSD